MKRKSGASPRVEGHDLFFAGCHAIVTLPLRGGKVTCENSLSLIRVARVILATSDDFCHVKIVNMYRIRTTTHWKITDNISLRDRRTLPILTFKYLPFFFFSFSRTFSNELFQIGPRFVIWEP